MDIGTGIALAGVWIFAGLVFTGSKCTDFAGWLALVVALGVTGFLK